MKFIFEKIKPSGPYEIVPHNYWRDWKWQLKNSLKSREDFEKIYNLTDAERVGFESSKGLFQIRSTPYYASLGSKIKASDPIRQIQTPHFKENGSKFQEMLDPLGEDKNSVTKRLIHRYPDRVLFLITDFCSVYCRFCTRKRFTGKNEAFLSDSEYKASLDYIKKHPGIREVILSGGDPLTLGDDALDLILKDLRSIEHIEIIRIGSRMPVVNPFRITPTLLNIFKKYKPVYLMNHFNHPKELSYEAAEALEAIADYGVPMMNQMVLLNGINNHPAIVQALSRRLLYLRVKPYYMFQCDPSLGTDHLRNSISDSLEIQQELWGNLSGLAMPSLSIDIPNGGGKVGMTPNYLISKKTNTWTFKGFDGVESQYKDPEKEFILKPSNISEYIQEWEELKRAKLSTTSGAYDLHSPEPLLEQPQKM